MIFLRVSGGNPGCPWMVWGAIGRGFGTLLVVVMEMLLNKSGKVLVMFLRVFGGNPGGPGMVWGAVGMGFGTLFGGSWVPLGGMGVAWAGNVGPQEPL